METTSGGAQHPEDAVFPELRRELVHVLGSEVNDDEAMVWVLTNDAPPYEPYTVFCDRDADGWHDGGGQSGFHSAIPAEAVIRARRLGYEYYA